MLRVPNQRNCRTYVFADLRRIHVNMDKHFVFRDQIGLVYRPVSYPRAHHEKEVRLVHGAVGKRLSVIAHHTVIHRMLGGHSADSHHGGNHGNAVFFRKCPKRILRLAKEHAAARTDQGAFRFSQLLDDLFYLRHIALYRRLVGTHIDFAGIFELRDGRILDINGDVDQHTTFPPC